MSFRPVAIRDIFWILNLKKVNVYINNLKIYFYLDILYIYNSMPRRQLFLTYLIVIYFFEIVNFIIYKKKDLLKTKNRNKNETKIW